MAEYAKKEVLIEKLLEIANDFEQHGGLMDVAFAVATNELAEMLKDKDCGIFEEAKPVVHAHWISASWEEDEENGIENTYSDEFICSNCEEHLIFYDAIEKEDIAGNYCPYCGAQMDEKESD